MVQHGYPESILRLKTYFKEWFINFTSFWSFTVFRSFWIIESSTWHMASQLKCFLQKFLSIKTAKGVSGRRHAGHTRIHIWKSETVYIVYSEILSIFLIQHAINPKYHMATIRFLHFLTLASELLKRSLYHTVILLSQRFLAFFEASFQKLRISTQLKAIAHEAATLRTDIALGETGETHGGMCREGYGIFTGIFLSCQHCRPRNATLEG